MEQVIILYTFASVIWISGVGFLAVWFVDTVVDFIRAIISYIPN